MYVCICVCMYVCMYLCLYVCMYVCMYLCLYLLTNCTYLEDQLITVMDLRIYGSHHTPAFNGIYMSECNDLPFTNGTIGVMRFISFCDSLMGNSFILRLSSHRNRESSRFLYLSYYICIWLYVCIYVCMHVCMCVWYCSFSCSCALM